LCRDEEVVERRKKKQDAAKIKKLSGGENLLRVEDTYRWSTANVEENGWSYVGILTGETSGRGDARSRKCRPLEIEIHSRPLQLIPKAERIAGWFAGIATVRS
jgi:hypothetical protein